MKTTAQIIKNAISAMKITQSELSKRTGISRALIGYYCSGKYEPKTENLFKIAKALNLNPQDFTEFSDESIPCIEVSPTHYIDHESDQIHLERYHRLNNKGQKKVNDYMDDLLEHPRYMWQHNKEE